MWNANNDDNFLIQKFSLDVQRFESAIAKNKVCEWKIDGACDVPSLEVILRSEVENNYARRFVLQQTDEIVGADAGRDFPLNVDELNAVDVLFQRNGNLMVCNKAATK